MFVSILQTFVLSLGPCSKLSTSCSTGIAIYEELSQQQAKSQMASFNQQATVHREPVWSNEVIFVVSVHLRWTVQILAWLQMTFIVRNLELYFWMK